MPNRLVREGLIDSEAMLSVPVDARWLFVVVMLSADDLGLFEATEFRLARRADVNRDLAARLMQLLQDADLIRLYEVEGKRYGFIPRFRQRVQIRKPKYPMPPLALLQDDPDAHCKIKHLTSNPTVVHPLDSDWRSDYQPSEAETETEERPESSTPTESQTLVAEAAPSATYRVPNCPTDELVALYHRHLPALPAVEVMNAGRKRTLAVRWREVCADGKLDRAGGLDWFSWFFQHVSRSDFLMGRVPGRSGKTWTANFDFLFTPAKFVRIVEGAYHHREVAK